MSGSLVVVGLGPGSPDLLTPAATRALQLNIRLDMPPDAVAEAPCNPITIASPTRLRP